MADPTAAGDEPAKVETTQKTEKPAEAVPSAEKPADHVAISLSGNVVDEKTGRPITNFIVQGGFVDKKDPGKILWGGFGTEGGRPNLTGEFSLPTLLDWSAGQRARIVASGYVSQPILSEPPKAGVKELRGLVVVMKRGREVSGHVFDYTGKPVKGAGVYVAGDYHLNIAGGRAKMPAGPYAGQDDRKAVRFTTDAEGAFTATGISGDTDRLAITCAALDLWVVPIPKADDTQPLEIRLPQPGRLVVHYDIPGAPEKAEIFMQLHIWEMPELQGAGNERYEPIQHHVELVLDNLTPGEYTIDRRKSLGQWEKPMLDRRTVKVEAGKTTVTDFVRPKGAPIAGQVTGLDQIDAAKAVPPHVYVRVLPPEGRGGPFGAAVIDELLLALGGKSVDGKFTTERMPPGRYKVQAAIYSGNMRSPTFEGEALVTVPEEGQPEPVTIPLSKAGLRSRGSEQQCRQRPSWISERHGDGSRTSRRTLVVCQPRLVGEREGTIPGRDSSEIQGNSQTTGDCNHVTANTSSRVSMDAAGGDRVARPGDDSRFRSNGICRLDDRARKHSHRRPRLTTSILGRLDCLVELATCQLRLNNSLVCRLGIFNVKPKGVQKKIDCFRRQLKHDLASVTGFLSKRPLRLTHHSRHHVPRAALACA